MSVCFCYTAITEIKRLGFLIRDNPIIKQDKRKIFVIHILFLQKKPLPIFCYLFTVCGKGLLFVCQFTSQICQIISIVIIHFIFAFRQLLI